MVLVCPFGQREGGAMGFVVIMLGCLGPFQAEYHRNFLSEGFDDVELRMVGPTRTVVTKSEPRGFRITIPPQKENLGVVGFVPQFKVRGDFEITLAYEILEREKPETGGGVGVSLYLTSDTPTKEAVHLIRVLSAKGNERVWATRMTTDEEGKRVKLSDEGIPFNALSGRLRCTRTGSKVTYSCAEEDGPFQEVHSDDFGTEELNMVRVGLENGNSKLPIDARFTDLTIRADELPGPSTAKPPQSASRLSWAIWGIVAFIVIGGFAYWRSRQSASHAESV